MKAIKITNQNLQITSDIKLEDLKKLQAVAPEALILFKKETPIFRVAAGDCECLSPAGIVFNDATADGSATLIVAREGEITREMVMEELGDVFFKLQEVEDQVNGVLESINSKFDRIYSDVEVQ